MLEYEFIVIRKIGCTNFAQIYAVDRVHCSDSDTDVTYEARFYEFEDLGSSINAYRARSIRRLSQRTVLRTTWQGLHVVVYRSGALGNCSEAADNAVQKQSSEGSKVQKQSSEGSPEETFMSPEISNTPMTKTRIKSTRQRESDRLRQKSRRKRIRQQKKQSQMISGDEEGPFDHENGNERRPEPDASIEVDEVDVRFFQVSQSTNRDLAILQMHPGPTRFAIEQHLLARQEKVILDEHGMAEFIAIKERELVYLCRQLSTFQPVLRKWHAHLFNMLRQLQAFESSSTESVRHRIELVSCKLRYKILKSGLDALPGYVTEAEGRVHLLKIELISTRRARKESLRRGKLKSKR